MDNLQIYLKKQKTKLIQNLIQKGIKDNRILDAFEKVDREKFIDKSLVNRAYDDNALPILDDQTISQPYTVCFMLELLEFEKGQKVLEIGTGCGYLTAILVELGLIVYSIERSKILFDSAKERLEKMKVNCNLFFGDGTEGWIANSPYDRVIISAASPNFPFYLSKQLNNDAIVICPVGDLSSQTMMKGLLRYDKFEISEHSSFRFVPLIGKNAWDV